MYKQTIWLDHAVTPPNTVKIKDNGDGTSTLTPAGEVIQQGTNMSAGNFNNMESGIQDATLASQIFGWAGLQQKRLSDANDALMDAEVLGEIQEITLTNTQKFPFNSSVDSPKTIALAKTRKNLYYSVEVEVKEHTGLVGEILISDKALNGFKIAYTGSGSSVTLTVRIKGGMT